MNLSIKQFDRTLCLKKGRYLDYKIQKLSDALCQAKIEYLKARGVLQKEHKRGTKTSPICFSLSFVGECVISCMHYAQYKHQQQLVCLHACIPTDKAGSCSNNLLLDKGLEIEESQL